MSSATQGALLVADQTRAYVGHYPSLAVLKHTYGDNAPRDWLMIQIEDLNAFIGSSQPMDVNQIASVSSLIAASYYYLKVSEFILFFANFKLGKYGKIFGSLKPNDITSALREFMSERSKAIEDIKAEQEKIKRESEKVMTHEEYLQLKTLEMT